MIRLVFLLTLFTASNIQAQSPTYEFWSDWPTIQIPKDPAASESLELETRWKFDCGLDADEMVGKIESVAPGTNGKVLLMDDQLTCVFVISPTGNLERVLGQPGVGPGDLPGAYRGFELKDGRIGACSGAPAMTFLFGGFGKIVLLDQADDPAGVWLGIGDPGTMPVATIRELRCANDFILCGGDGIMGEETGFTVTQELAVLNPVDGTRNVLVRNENYDDLSGGLKILEINEFQPFAYGRCDISSTGRVAFSPQRDTWQVVVRNHDGTGFVMERDWDPVERSKEKKLAIHKHLGGLDSCVVLDHEPAVKRIRWRPNGRLWVEPFGVDPGEGAMACFDEFSPSGEYLRRVKIEVPGARPSDELKLMEDGRLVFLRGFKAEQEDESDFSTEAEVILMVPKEDHHLSQ